MNHGFTFRERLPAAAAGQLLLDDLERRWRHGTRDDWRGRLARGEVTLDGLAARGDERLTAGTELAWHRPPWEEPQAPLACALLWRDEHFLAVAKPAGLPTMPSGGRFLEHTLLHQVRRRFPEASLLHRLDRGTSGVVLLARTAAARSAGSKLFRDGTIERTYRGRVIGAPTAERLWLDAPIGERPHPTLGRVFAAVGANEAGRAARTEVSVIERDAGTTLVAIRIDSGRPHQIRIHLAWAGFALEGEPFFGAAGLPIEGTLKRPGDIGYALHALSLVAPHPLADGSLSIWCAPPPRLRAHGEVPVAPPTT